MHPVMRKGDWIFVSPFVEKPQIGDVVIIQDPLDEETTIMRRVIGCENQKIHINTNGTIYISENVVEQKELDHDQTYRYIEELFYVEKKPISWRIVKKVDPVQDRSTVITIPNDKLFVLTDNRDSNLDSRHWGNIDQNMVKGVVILRFGTSDPWQDRISFY